MVNYKDKSVVTYSNPRELLRNETILTRQDLTINGDFVTIYTLRDVVGNIYYISMRNGDVKDCYLLTERDGDEYESI